jgi:hypothetical protein
MSVNSNSGEQPYGEPLQPGQLEPRHTYLVADTRVEPPQPIANLTINGIASRPAGEVALPCRGDPRLFDGTWRNLSGQSETHVLVARRAINSIGSLGVFASHGGTLVNLMWPGYGFFAVGPDRKT